METVKGRSQYYNKQMDMGVILLNREPGIIPPGWSQETASVVVK